VDTALEDADSDVSDYLEEIEAYDEPFLGSLKNDITDLPDPQIPSIDPEHADALVDEIVKFLNGDA